MDEDVKMFVKIGAGVLALILLVVVATTSVGCVDPGHRGVKVTMGKVDPYVLGEGAYFKKPFIQSVVEIDVRTNKVEVNTEASSKDLQIVETKVALNEHLDPSAVARVYSEIGPDYKDRVVVPAIYESLKQSTAMFTAEELIGKRAEAKAATVEALRARLQPVGVVVEELSITDFKFSKSFNEAIEAKVTAEQLKLKASRDLERIKIEAEQAKAKAEGEKSAAIAQAEGEAAKIKIINEQLHTSPQYVEWMRVSRWNGVLPTVTGGAVPMFNVGSVK